DRGRLSDAPQSYERALASDHNMADAHYNLALLYERAGKKAEAIRHLSAYKKAVEGR
ncbi:MAG: tetratricopeptide repeat protein, partial [Thermoanaerobaculia bacterium]